MLYLADDRTRDDFLKEKGIPRALGTGQNQINISSSSTSPELFLLRGRLDLKKLKPALRAVTTARTRRMGERTLCCRSSEVASTFCAALITNSSRRAA